MTMFRDYHYAPEYYKRGGYICPSYIYIVYIVVTTTMTMFRDYHYAPEYYKRGGYICPSDIYYGRPKRAVNTYGKWKVT